MNLVPNDGDTSASAIITGNDEVSFSKSQYDRHADWTEFRSSLGLVQYE
jgi:hypothetical protein